MLGQDQNTFAATDSRQQQPIFADDPYNSNPVGQSLNNIVPQFGEQPKVPGRSHRQQMLVVDGDSSGLGSNDHGMMRGGLADKSLELRQMVRGSLNSDDDLMHNIRHHNVPTNDDLTLDMLGGGGPNQPASLQPPTQGSSFQPMTSKDPPSSALNLHANLEPSSVRDLRPSQPSNPPTASGSEPAISLE